MIRYLAAALLMATACSNAGSTDSEVTARYFVAVRLQLDPRAQAALDQMDGLGRQLLAARAYLRAGTSLDQRWSWTQEQIDGYPGSPAQLALDAEIARVRSAFEKNNPGYTLFVSPQVRSLDLQLQRWNQNASITRAGDHMVGALKAAIRVAGFPPPDTGAGSARFRELVANHMPTPVPTLAAPGLSSHGRMSAVDFQIRRGSITIAGPDSTTVESVWIAQGWRDKLRTAVIAASVQFKEPLASPVEPWHYDYEPAVDAPPD